MPIRLLVPLLVAASTFTAVSALTIGMATSDNTRSVAFFDADTNELLAVFSYPSTARNPLDCSMLPDQSAALVPAFNIQTYRINTQAPPIRFDDQIVTFHFGIDTAISADGKYVLECGGNPNDQILTINTEGGVVSRRSSSCTAVDICADGTVITATQPRGRVTVWKLQPDGSLQFLNGTSSIGDPFNVTCAPDSSSVVVVRRPSATMHSLSLPDLQILDTSPLSGPGVSGVFHPDGGRFYVRGGSTTLPGASEVQAFAYDPTTASFGVTPIFAFRVSRATGFFGVDQLAIHPDGSTLYFTEPREIVAHDASDGRFVRALRVPGAPSGICLPSVVLEGNRRPRSVAGPDVRLECDGDLAASTLLDGSGSGDWDSTPETNDDIVEFEWLNGFFGGGTVELGFGEQLDSSLPFGASVVDLVVHDRAGNSDSDRFVARVEDNIDPTIAITAPPEGSCHGPSALPVIVESEANDSCDPDLDIGYSPGPGPGYTVHGDYNVSVRALDEGGNIDVDRVRFTIDTVAPIVEILEPDGQALLLPTTLPFDVVFESQDADRAAGEVLHEVLKVDGCVAYDGFSYGDGDGLLHDETLRLDLGEFCRIGAACGFDELVRPIIAIEAVDCGGNVGAAAEQIEGTLLLDTESCAP